MAQKNKPRKHVSEARKTFSFKRFCHSYINYGYWKSLFLDPSKLFPTACFLFVLECIINVTVINYVKYTEIDWRAYIQEVEGVLNGTFDYSLLKGDTGPLVYPAGFVWIFSCLYYVTDNGKNILLAQYIFALLYLINLILILRIYLKCKKLPPYVLILTCLTSYRIHSIFVLRLFNDPVAIILLYASINAFLDSRWNLGSFLYSMAVSVKMNILLFAPALLLAYLKCLGLMETIHQLMICACLQGIIALPFLVTNPVNYLVGAFNLGRVFLYEWTVNWKFLPEYLFVDKRFHIALLVVHLFFLALFYKSCSLHLSSYAKLKAVETGIKPQLKKNSSFNMNTSAQLLVLPLFLSNFVGVACSRSLHYQFYIWYFHTLPFLLWSTHYSIPTRLAILGIIELCWNTFPSTWISSVSLLICHLAVLYGIHKTQSKLLGRVNNSQATLSKNQ
ncbi:hypothetical protein RUM43_003561 [Polyplax serrata]|uniref:dolichyl-P-Man:Man5GlcNAc2-PP-dolichol alpha-1,3-mannosyltransferase n=1 Tax=Polyplax serrata TaxID=468196 RepID=A0AAN8PEZ4_POLSC